MRDYSIISTVIFVTAGIIALCYMIPLAMIHPAPALVFAICFEIVWFAILLSLRLRRIFSVDGRAQDVVVEQVVEELKTRLWGTSSQRLQDLLKKAAIALALLATTLISIDLASFLTAYCGDKKAAVWMYEHLPVSTIVGFNATASLELLGGACAEAGKFDTALPYFEDVREIRESFYGPESEKVAAIHADLGDLYRRIGDIDLAEKNYRIAIEKANKALKNSGSGRAYTRLAILLTEAGRLGPADEAFQKALEMRTRQFGKDSPKVAETLFAYAVMLDKQGRHDDALTAQHRAEELVSKLKAGKGPFGIAQGNSQNRLQAITTLILLAVSFVVSWKLFGRKGILTTYAIKRLSEQTTSREASRNETDGTDEADGTEKADRVNAADRDSSLELLKRYRDGS